MNSEELIDQEIRKFGMMVDEAGDKSDLEIVKKAQELGRDIFAKKLSNTQTTIMHYFMANSWNSMRIALGQRASTEWEQPEIEQEIIELRRALNSNGFESLNMEFCASILTNAGSKLSELARPIEAIPLWNRALEIAPTHGMAFGNRGMGLFKMAQLLYDESHAHIYLKYACDDLEKALASNGVYEAAMEIFKDTFEHIKDFREHPVPDEEHSLGDSKEEIKYREWCLKERLFLNPLNDITTNTIVAHDVFSLPSMVTKLKEPPSFFGFYNQLKQEFVSARFHFYQAVTSEGVHFSDKGVLLLNTLDYPSYGLATERLKIAYRSSYSLFDKIAYFIRHYFQLDIDPKAVYFKTIWYKNGDRKSKLDAKLTGQNNLPLRGLFWLSKDIFHPNDEFKFATEPDAQMLWDIRNHLEHKYLKAHDDLWEIVKEYEDEDSIRRDPLSFSINVSSFEKKTRKVLGLVRAALIYLSLAINVEEQKKLAAKEGPVGEMSMDVWDDDWKQRF